MGGLMTMTLEAKLKRLEGLIDTDKVSGWENRFLQSIVPTVLKRAQLGQIMRLTDKQRQVVDGLISKHFAA